MIDINKPCFVSLPNRGLLHLEGPDRHAFLQDLITNDIGKLPPGKALYACLLTPQGKFLHDFFIHEGEGFTLLDCEGGNRARDLYDRLLRYRLRKNVQISIEENNPVYAVLGIPTGIPDPRHDAIGYRSFIKPDLEERPFDVWDTRRIQLCIPDGSRDMELEKSTLLEAHIDTFNGIDFNKGCYMGQELTARMHYRGLAKRHLYTVHGNLPAPFTDLPDGGQMRSSCGSIGIALLKDEAVPEMKDEHGHIRLLG